MYEDTEQKADIDKKNYTKLLCVEMQAHKESKSMQTNEVKKERLKQTEHFDSNWVAARPFICVI